MRGIVGTAADIGRYGDGHSGGRVDSGGYAEGDFNHCDCKRPFCNGKRSAVERGGRDERSNCGRLRRQYPDAAVGRGGQR